MSAASNFSAADLTDAQPVDATLFDTGLDRATLTGADLTGADLGEAQLRFVNANDAVFAYAILDDAKLSASSFEGADFSDAILLGADAAFSNFRDAVFTGAMLDGAVIAVGRNEKGDETGFGMRICRAEPATPGQWDCVTDPKKYDSPLLFKHGSDIYLLGRRNVTDTGNYDLFMEELTLDEQSRQYNIEYWFESKRCSLWQVDPVSLTVTFVLDLPSKGDTCFPGLVPLPDGRYRVYNYSSPPDGEDYPWQTGQLNPTQIYAVTLALP